MKIKINNEQYDLNVEDAARMGALRKAITCELSLDENETAALYYVLARVGGDNEKARSYINGIYVRMMDQGAHKATCDKPLETWGPNTYINLS